MNPTASMQNRNAKRIQSHSMANLSDVELSLLSDGLPPDDAEPLDELLSTTVEYESELLGCEPDDADGSLVDDCESFEEEPDDVDSSDDSLDPLDDELSPDDELALCEDDLSDELLLDESSAVEYELELAGVEEDDSEGLLLLDSESLEDWLEEESESLDD